LPRELDRAGLQRLWREVAELGAAKIIITGGEPLVRPDIIPILEDLKRCTEGGHSRRCLNTNGALVTPDLAAQIVPLVDEVRLSIDGLEPQNDSARGTGAFRAAVRAFKIFRAAGAVPRILVTITDPDPEALSALLRFLNELGATQVQFNRLRPVGRAASAWHRFPDRGAIEKAITSVLQQPPVAPLPDRPHWSNCGVGSFLNVWADGEVYPCHVLTSPRFRCGNVRTCSIREICGPGSLIARLRELDFARVARLDPALAPLAAPDACLGEVWRTAPALPIWQQVLG
jgi:MoaA/NifB/PqqE/SkfB family radical SAM enzyme